MKDKFAWAWWLRGAAISCQLNQELTDRALIIYFPYLGNVGPETISINYEQDKSGEYSRPFATPIQSAEDLHLFSDGRMLPYISAVHCYALEHPQGIAVRTVHGYNLRHPEQDQEAPRYQIDFIGLKAYRDINERIAGCIRSMIHRSKNLIYIMHERKDTLHLLRQQLPFANEHPDSNTWHTDVPKRPNSQATNRTVPPRKKRSRKKG